MRGLGRVLGFSSGESIDDVLTRNKGAGPGFDLIRVVLAVLIFFAHTHFLAGAIGADPIAPASVLQDGAAHVKAHMPRTGGWDGWGRSFRVCLVPMFFALSGFLVSGSAFRLRRVSTFLSFRVLRILPALLTEITLSALLLGPLFTNRPLRAYFSDPGFFAYFGNVVGRVRFYLPGVFADNPAHAVNVNLWTLPSEFDCYLITAVLMGLGLFYNRTVITAAMLVATAILIPLNFFTDFAVTKEAVSEFTLVFYFFMGATVYQWRDRIRLTPLFFAVAAGLAYLLLLSPHAVFVAPLFLTYVTVWLGMIAIPKLPVIKHGDYSYGVYLYGFPICQAIIAAFPGMIGHRWALVATGGLATFAFAAFSWHLIEKPTLRLKNALPARLFPPAKHIPVLQEPALNRGARSGEFGISTSG